MSAAPPTASMIPHVRDQPDSPSPQSHVGAALVPAPKLLSLFVSRHDLAGRGPLRPATLLLSRLCSGWPNRRMRTG